MKGFLAKAASRDLYVVYGLIGVVLVLIVILIILDSKDKKKRRERQKLYDTMSYKNKFVTESAMDSELKPLEKTQEIPIDDVYFAEPSNDEELIEGEPFTEVIIKPLKEEYEEVREVSKEEKVKPTYNDLDDLEDFIPPKKEVEVKPVEVAPVIEKTTSVVKEEETQPDTNKKLMDKLDSILEKNITAVEPKKEVKKENTPLNDLEELTKNLEQVESRTIDLTRFEEEQEKTAIISMDELMAKSNELYDSNEEVQYDEGNEPISVEELKARFAKEQTIETLEIDDVEVIGEEIPEVITEDDDIEVLDIEPDNKAVFNTTFQRSEYISPIYGIQENKNEWPKNHPAKLENLRPEVEKKDNSISSIEKLNIEMQKTDEALRKLRDLQKNL